MEKNQPKTILIDLRPLLGGRVSGVENYITSLVKNLLKIDKKNQYILWVNSHKKFEFPAEFSGKNVQQVKTSIPNKILNLSFSFGHFPLLEWIIKPKFDLVFLPDPRPIATKKPIIATFHDLSFEIFPQFFNFKTRLWHKILKPKNLANKSAKIITPSFATKKDLMQIYKILGKKIEVVYEAPITEKLKITPEEREKTLDKFEIFQKYIFTLSTLEPRKNLEKLLLAYDIAKTYLKFPHKLVIAGSPNAKIFAKMPSLKKTKDIIFTGFVNEKEKQILMQNAEFFVNVSLLEGFGLPVAEAIALGTPCLVANNSSLPEIAGKAGHSVNPERVSSISNGIKELIQNKNLLENLRKNCKLQAKKFSWEKAAQETLEVLTK